VFDAVGPLITLMGKREEEAERLDSERTARIKRSNGSAASPSRQLETTLTETQFASEAEREIDGVAMQQ